MKSINFNGKTLRSDLISGFATGLFSIPEGMAYAKLAGVNPLYGLYSGMIPTIVASLTTGSILMISTLTSAIALSTASVIQVAGIQNSQMPQALFTITLLVGAIMFVMGLLRHSGNLSVKPSRRALELGRHAKSWTICSLCLWRGDGHCGCLRPGITRGLHDFCRVIAFY